MASEGPSYIVVNNEAGTAVVDAASDLVQYMEARSAPEASAELHAALAELKATSSSAAQSPFLQLASHAAVLLKTPPADFESVLNLTWFVLASAPDFDAVVHLAVSQLTSPLPTVVPQQVALQAVLVSLFNIVPSSSSEKPFVFSKILALAVSTRTLDQYVPQLPQLAEWLPQWTASSDLKREIVLSVARALKSSLVPNPAGVYEVSKHSLALREFLTSCLQTDPQFTEIATILVAETLADGDLSLERTLYRPGVLPASVLALEGVQALKTAEADLFKALEAIVDGDYAAFCAIAAPEIAENALFVKHARVAALARLASRSESNELTYAQIAEVAGVASDAAEVEPLVVDAVKSGLVQGRMNQLQQRFVVESTTVVGPLTSHHWDVIESRLHAWQKSLKAVLDTSSKARNNYDLVKALNKLEVN